jgi:hypothetical protein
MIFLRQSKQFLHWICFECPGFAIGGFAKTAFPANEVSSATPLEKHDSKINIYIKV